MAYTTRMKLCPFNVHIVLLLNCTQEYKKINKILQESQMWNLLLVTQHNDDENVNMTYSEDESLNNNSNYHELITKMIGKMHKVKNLFFL
jgi:hypothetical protein